MDATPLFALDQAGPRPRPIRYDLDAWLMMRNDPVLPAATIYRRRNPDGREFFLTVTWDLNVRKRHLVDGYGNLDDADGAVLYRLILPVVGDPNESMESLHEREEEQAGQMERERLDRVTLYGP